MENKKLLEKARQANSPEELLALAKENDVELTREQAEAFFEHMNKSGELSDDELANAAGGGACKTEEVIYIDVRCSRCGTIGLYRKGQGKLRHNECPKCGLVFGWEFV